VVDVLPPAPIEISRGDVEHPGGGAEHRVGLTSRSGQRPKAGQTADIVHHLPEDGEAVGLRRPAPVADSRWCAAPRQEDDEVDHREHVEHPKGAEQVVEEQGGQVEAEHAEDEHTPTARCRSVPFSVSLTD